MDAETVRSHLSSTFVSEETVSEQQSRRLAAEIIQSWKAGQKPDANLAIQEHPQLGHYKSIVLDLAYEEYCLRSERGESVATSEFCEQFSHYQRSIQNQIQLHEFVCESDFFDDQADPWPEMGDQVFGCTIEAELGRGAFGRVYLASQAELGGRLVAVKLCYRGAKEADTLGKLNHKHIVPIYSVTHNGDGLSAIVMPYLGRATLHDLLDYVGAEQLRRRSGIAIREAIRIANGGARDADSSVRRSWWGPGETYQDAIVGIAAKLADALASAHDAKILHLDLKPSNVLITDQGEPQLLDFNLSFDQQQGEPQLGGTVPYMSPEQLVCIAEGESTTRRPVVDQRSDVFSLGVLIHELLTLEFPCGTLPPDLSSEQLAAEILGRYRASSKPLRLPLQGSNELGAIIHRCLMVDPEGRFQSARELRDALRAEIRWTRRFRRWIRSHPVRSSLAAGTGILLLSAAITAGMLRAPRSVRLFEQGREAFVSGRYEAAQEILANAIEEGLPEGRHAEALYLRAIASCEMENWVVAQQSVEEWSRLDPPDPLPMKAYCSIKGGYSASVIGVYAELIAAGRRSVDIYNNYGYCLARRGRFAAAIDAFDAGVELDDTVMVLYLNRAWCHYQWAEAEQRIPTEAVADVQRALDLGPPSVYLHRDAAVIYGTAFQYDKRYHRDVECNIELARQLGLERKDIQKYSALVEFLREHRPDLLAAELDQLMDPDSKPDVVLKPYESVLSTPSR